MAPFSTCPCHANDQTIDCWLDCGRGQSHDDEDSRKGFPCMHEYARERQIGEAAPPSDTARLLAHVDAANKARAEAEPEIERGRPMPPPESDPINNPRHYTTGKIEVIDFIEDQRLSYHRASVIKYLCRAPHKGTELQDLRKAQWYLNREIERMEADE